MATATTSTTENNLFKVYVKRDDPSMIVEAVVVSPENAEAVTAMLIDRGYRVEVPLRWGGTAAPTSITLAGGRTITDGEIILRKSDGRLGGIPADATAFFLDTMIELTD